MRFGDYVLIEQKRYEVENEMYVHKVVGCLKSNTYIDVPVEEPKKETIHSKTVDVVGCITCGVNERLVHRYKISDVKRRE